MRVLAAGMFALMLTSMANPGLAQPPTAVQAAQACLQANAAQVAREDRSLDSAAGFLVNYVCAVQVETASRWIRNSELIDVLSHGAPDASSKLKVDPVTGRLLVPTEPGKSPTDGLGAINILQSGFAPTVAPSLKASAARLILEARSKVRNGR